MYPKPRSANNELHIGCNEGSCAMPRKDWGGPRDARTSDPAPDYDRLDPQRN